MQNIVLYSEAYLPTLAGAVSASNLETNQFLTIQTILHSLILKLAMINENVEEMPTANQIKNGRAVTICSSISDPIITVNYFVRFLASAIVSNPKFGLILEYIDQLKWQSSNSMAFSNCEIVPVGQNLQSVSYHNALTNLAHKFVKAILCTSIIFTCVFSKCAY